MQSNTSMRVNVPVRIERKLNLGATVRTTEVPSQRIS